MSFTLKIKTFIKRKLVKVFNFSRPTSWPYISGDSFRALAQFVYDESYSFNPKDVKNGDIVFVRTGWLKEFFEKIEGSIENPYILISHNDDFPVGEEYLTLYKKSGKIIHWFAQNLTFKDSNFTPIPIGLQNFYYKGIGLPSDIRSVKELCLQKNKTVICSFSTNGNGNQKERSMIIKICSKLPWVENVRAKQMDYFKEVSKNKFVISPAGSGEDCHRTWEALYLNAIPVVKRTPMTDHYESLGIPLYILNSWEDLALVTKEDLDTFYDKESLKLGTQAIYMEYWVKTIHNKINSYNL